MLLLRIPNAFTAPSNVIAGYFALTSVQDTSISLTGLIVSSVLLYISGIVFNDYFDIEIDRKERPNRPLPAGLISKNKSLLIAILLLTIGNIITLLINPISFVVSILISVVMIAYDYRLKFMKTSPVIMGTARALNVLLGSSISFININHSESSILKLIIISFSIFLYTLSITMLSKNEVNVEKQRSKIIIPFIVNFGIIGFLFLSIVWQIFDNSMLIFLCLFMSIIIWIFKKTVINKHSIDTSPIAIQNAIKNMVISIIILDSSFISGSIGTIYGFLTLLLILPSMVLAKKLYVT